MKLFCSLLLSACFCSLAAQDSLNSTLKQQMIKDWQRAKAYTQEYLDAMPAAQYSFRATDSVRSFAQQMLHLAFGNVALVTVGTGIHNSDFQSNVFGRDPEKSPTAQNKDSVVYYVTGSYDFIINAIQSADFSKLSEIVNQRTPGGERSETRLAWLLKAFEHQTHHRGQCTIYLRLAGIKPPAEKLF